MWAGYLKLDSNEFEAPTSSAHMAWMAHCLVMGGGETACAKAVADGMG